MDKMPSFESAGKLLLLLGLFFAVLGLLMLLGSKVPFLGRLPGDIHIQNERFSLFMPLGTSLLLSIVLTVLLNLVFRFLGR